MNHAFSWVRSMHSGRFTDHCCRVKNYPIGKVCEMTRVEERPGVKIITSDLHTANARSRSNHKALKENLLILTVRFCEFKKRDDDDQLAIIQDICQFTHFRLYRMIDHSCQREPA